MLKQLRIKNFRLLRDVTIDFDDDLTVFIGPNAAGKSTVLEVLDLLQRLATSQTLSEAVEAHGGFSSFRTIGSREPVEFGAALTLRTEVGTPEERDWELDWRIALQATSAGGVHVVSETLQDNETSPSTVLITTNDKGERYAHPEGGKAARVAIRNAQLLGFHAFADPSRFTGLGFLKIVLSEIHVLGAIEAAPSWARAEQGHASPRDPLVVAPRPFLGRQGIGLANVLYGFFNDHAEAWKELERAFRGEFPFVRRIVFPPDPGGGKISFAIEDTRFGDRKLYASEMSDGMIAYLCLLVAILHPNHLGIVGLDEPDACIHPTALRRFLSLAQRKHTRRRLAIVTHSNALIDELERPAESIRIVEGGPNGAVIRRLDPKALAAWRKDYSISEMRKTGLLDASNTATGLADS